MFSDDLIFSLLVDWAAGEMQCSCACLDTELQGGDSAAGANAVQYSLHAWTQSSQYLVHALTHRAQRWTSDDLACRLRHQRGGCSRVGRQAGRGLMLLATSQLRLLQSSVSRQALSCSSASFKRRPLQIARLALSRAAMLGRCRRICCLLW